MTDKVIKRLEQIRASFLESAGKKAIESIIYYDNEKRSESLRRAALRDQGNAEGIGHAIHELMRT